MMMRVNLSSLKQQGEVVTHEDHCSRILCNTGCHLPGNILVRMSSLLITIGKVCFHCCCECNIGRFNASAFCKSNVYIIWWSQLTSICMNVLKILPSMCHQMYIILQHVA